MIWAMGSRILEAISIVLVRVVFGWGGTRDAFVFEQFAEVGSHINKIIKLTCVINKLIISDVRPDLFL